MTFTRYHHVFRVCAYLCVGCHFTSFGARSRFKSVLPFRKFSVFTLVATARQNLRISHTHTHIQKTTRSAKNRIKTKTKRDSRTNPGQQVVGLVLQPNTIYPLFLVHKHNTNKRFTQRPCSSTALSQLEHNTNVEVHQTSPGKISLANHPQNARCA